MPQSRPRVQHLAKHQFGKLTPGFRRYVCRQGGNELGLELKLHAAHLVRISLDPAQPLLYDPRRFNYPKCWKKIVDADILRENAEIRGRLSRRAPAKVRNHANFVAVGSTRWIGRGRRSAERTNADSARNRKGKTDESSRGPCKEGATDLADQTIFCGGSRFNRSTGEQEEWESACLHCCHRPN